MGHPIHKHMNRGMFNSSASKTPFNQNNYQADVVAVKPDADAAKTAVNPERKESRSFDAKKGVDRRTGLTPEQQQASNNAESKRKAENPDLYASYRKAAADKKTWEDTGNNFFEGGDYPGQAALDAAKAAYRNK